jgi:hypothetical protein
MVPEAAEGGFTAGVPRQGGSDQSGRRAGRPEVWVSATPADRFRVDPAPGPFWLRARGAPPTVKGKRTETEVPWPMTEFRSIAPCS